MKSPEDIAGFEYRWFATDGSGNVALFTTGGAGYAPRGFLADTDRYDIAFDTLLNWPASTPVKFAPILTVGVKNIWRLAAERGVFAYDCDPNGGPYCLVAVPVVAARLDDLPSEIADAASDLNFPHLDFPTTKEIRTDQLDR
jgi:hypothetical protein